MVLTGACEAIVVDVQCIFPALGPLSKCFHTKFITTSPIARIPDSDFIEFHAESAGENAKNIVKTAIENFKNRRPELVNIPDLKTKARVGYSLEAIKKELDGVCWSGITEDYTSGWADQCHYYLTNNINGGWIGSYIVNSEKWKQVPEHLKELFRLTCDSSNFYRLHWYWWGEANYRVTGGKMELTSIPDAEWAQVEAEAHKFWDETAKRSPRLARAVDILKAYNEQMNKAGRPYRY